MKKLLLLFAVVSILMSSCTDKRMYLVADPDTDTGAYKIYVTSSGEQ